MDHDPQDFVAFLHVYPRRVVVRTPMEHIAEVEAVETFSEHQITGEGVNMPPKGVG